MQVTFAGIKLQSVTLVWEYNELSNEASIDLSQHHLGLTNARMELDGLNYPGIEIKDRFAIISDVKTFKSMHPIHKIPQASTSMTVLTEPSSESMSSTGPVVVLPSGQKIPIISFSPLVSSSALSNSFDAAPLDSAKKSPQVNPSPKSETGNISPTCSSDGSGIKTISPKTKPSPRNLWGIIRPGSSSIEASPRLKKTLSTRSIFSPKSTSLIKKSLPPEVDIYSKSPISPSYLSTSASLPFDSIAMEKLFANDNDMPGQWGDTLAYHTHWIKKNDDEMILSAAKFLRSKNDILSNQGFVCKKSLYKEKNELIILLSDLMNAHINPIYQYYLETEKPDREVQRHIYSYFRQAVLDAMLDNKLLKNPNELRSLTKEEKYTRFNDNHALYLFANQQLDSIRTQLKLFRLMILVSSDIPLSILDNEGSNVQKGITWMRNYSLKHMPRQSVISEQLKQIECVIIEIEKIQRLINKDTQRLINALKAQEPVIELKRTLTDITTSVDAFHSFNALLQKQLEEKLPKTNKMTEDEFFSLASKTAREIALLTIHQLYLQFRIVKPDRRFMSFLKSGTDLSFIDTGSDQDFYLSTSWAEQLSSRLAYYPFPPKLPLKEKSRRFQNFKQQLAIDIKDTILSLYADCLEQPLASTSYII